MQFPTKIPIRVPWQPNEWPPAKVGAFTEDKRLPVFIAEWQSELRQRPGAPRYLEFVTACCGYRPDADFSAEALISMLWKTVELVSKKPIEVEHPVAAFELVSTMDGLAEFALERLPKKAKKQVEEAHVGVSGSVVIFAYQAVTRHFADLASVK